MLRRLRAMNLFPQAATSHIRYLTRATVAATTPPVPLKSPTTDPSSSLTLYFLKNSCGLSPESALSVCQKIQLKSTKNPHSVLTLLKTHGFSMPDIAKLITRRPQLLRASPVKTLKPKLDFFQSIGFSGPDLATLLTSVPSLLLFSLDNRLIPNFNLLKTILHTNENVIAAIKSSASLLVSDLRTVLLPEIKTLQEYGAPMAVIFRLLTNHPKSLVGIPNRFEEILEVIKKMSISPSTPIFAHAFGVLTRLPKPEWERKLENFKRLGWSEEEVLRAFAKHPYCMSASSEKIKKIMEFLREKLNWEPAYISANPVVLSLSFDKRIVPRCEVISILASKGLVKGRVGARHLMIGEKEFLKNYVIKYHEQIPEVADAIQGKIGVLSLEMGHKKQGIDI